jgi:hypothetical protein
VPTEFLPLPVPGSLICDEPFWRYPSGCIAGEGVAHLRVWGVADGMPGWAGGVRLVLLSETGLGASITNSIEEIHAVLTAQYGRRLVLLEHWPAEAGTDTGEHLDQVIVVDGAPHWRRIWPTPPTNPRHPEFTAWMDAHGHRALADTNFEGGGQVRAE